MLLILAGVLVSHALGSAGFEICEVASECKAGEQGGLGGELNAPFGVAVNPGTGNVYVADDENNRIQEFDSSGNFLRAWGKGVVSGGGTGFEICTVASECKAGEQGGLGGELFAPASVAVGPESVYVADTGNERIQEFSPTGNFLRAWGKDVISGGGTGFEICEAAAECKAGEQGELGGELSEPTGLGVGPTENVYVADTLNDRVQEYDSTGNFQRAWGKDVISGGGTGFEICEVASECKAGEQGELGGELDIPAGISVSPAETAYAVDGQNNRIQEFNPKGGFLRAWGKDVVNDAPAPTPSPAPSPSPPVPAEPSSLPAPGFAKTVNAEPVSGTVLIKRRGSSKFQALTGAEQIPVGSILDTTSGRVSLTSAKTRGGVVETADFYAGVFSVLQSAEGKPTTELKLVDRLSAPGRRLARSSASRASRKSHSSNGLWGSGHGNYVTKGHYGSATVRGTVWLTEDRPGGTFFEAKKDIVVVRDFTRGRTILLHTGQRYLARAR
jgi:DNA-binding beta-propeller fold protein YncE